MSYQALYRRFRPQSFDEVKGQDAIVTALKNQITNNRIGHAYLFCGTRGTGKTSVAKLLAKAINCTASKDGNPCGSCASCRAIAAGSSMNVVEMDAASHNGVDDVRTINEEVAYSPTEGKYRVYIIDEVHMFSNQAFNALLKTLEEPPEYVVFILATTDVNKLPITILSRCQRYDFRRITVATVADRMAELLEVDSVKAQPEALRYIARCADGSMRDALSLLDRCIAFYFGEEITYDRVLEVLGAVDSSVYSHIFRLILDRNISEVLKQLEEIVLQGRELTQFVTDLIWYLRNLMLAKTASGIEEVLDVGPDRRKLLEEEALGVSMEELMRDIRVLSDLQESMKYSDQKRVLIEIALIRLCKPQMESEQNIDTVMARLAAVESMLERGVVTSGQQAVQQSVQAAESQEEKLPLPQALAEDVKRAVGMWKQGSIQQELDGYLKSLCRQGRISSSGDNLILAFPDKNMCDKFRQEDSLQQLHRAFETHLGKSVELVIEQFDQQKSFGSQFPDIDEMIKFEVTEEE